MKTEYTIIWVDDELDTVSTDISDIIEFLGEKGIQANIQTFEATEEEGIHDKIMPALRNPDLDLIVVDFKMDGMNGRDLIDAIRDTDHVFLPVVFYSSAGVAALHKEALEAQLDGVYFSSRDRVANKIREVASSLLVKEQTSKGTRGLLMEGVSELDAHFGSLFLLMWGDMNDEGKSSLQAYLKEKIQEKSTQAQMQLAALPENLDELRSYLAEKFVSGSFDTITRWKVLKKQFQIRGQKDEAFSVFCRLFDKVEGQPTLISLRNEYGHKTRAQLEPTHNDGVCIGVRNELRAQLSNMNDLLRNE